MEWKRYEIPKSAVRSWALKLGAMFGAWLIASLVLFMSSLPAQVVVPWEEGQCAWFNGTIVNKEIDWTGAGGTEYKFYVEGTLDNNTSFKSVVYGDQGHYLLLPIGSTYESRVCDTVPLRTAILNGTVKVIEWVIH